MRISECKKPIRCNCLDSSMKPFQAPVGSPKNVWFGFSLRYLKQVVKSDVDGVNLGNITRFFPVILPIFFPNT